MPNRPVYLRKVVLLFAALIMALGATPALGQSEARVIQWSEHPQGSNNERSSPPLQLFKELEDIELEEVQVEGRPVAIGMPVDATVDWLRNISFRIKNVSRQPLAFVQITLTLPQLKTPIQVPYVGCSSPNLNKPCVQPGGEVLLTMPGGVYDWVKGKASDQGVDFSGINRATVTYVMVDLVGGAQQSSGCVKTSDVNNPCRYSP